MTRTGTILCFCFYFLFVSSAMAATYYTSPSGTGDGSAIGTPRAWSSGSWASAGDTVYLLDGSYSGWTVPVSGSSGSSITFESVNRLGAFFTSITAVSKSYVVIDGVRVAATASPAYAVWLDTCSHVTFQDSLIHGDPEDDYSPSAYGIFLDDSADCLVTRNEIAHLYHCKVTGSGCMATQLEGYSCTGNVVSYNYIHDISGSFLRTGITGGGNLFAYNRACRQSRLGSTAPHGSGMSIHSEGDSFIGNILYDLGESYTIATYDSVYGTEAQGGYDGVTIQDNLVFDTEDRHISGYYEYLLNPVSMIDVDESFLVQNNTLMGGFSSGASGGISFYQFRFGDYSGLSILSNIGSGLTFSVDYYEADGVTRKTSTDWNAVTADESDDDLPNVVQDNNWLRYGFSSKGCGYMCWWGDEYLDAWWPDTGTSDRVGLTTVDDGAGTIFLTTNTQWPYAFTIDASSPVAGTADPATSSTTDILGNARGETPSPGVYEPETVALLPPNCIYGTTPLRGATAVAANQTISWTAPLRASTYNVYVGTTWPPALRSSGQAGTSYSTSGLSLPSSTKVYWRVESVGTNGTTMSDEYWYTTDSGEQPTYFLIRSNP